MSDNQEQLALYLILAGLIGGLIWMLVKSSASGQSTVTFRRLVASVVVGNMLTGGAVWVATAETRREARKALKDAAEQYEREIKRAEDDRREAQRRIDRANEEYKEAVQEMRKAALAMRLSGR